MLQPCLKLLSLSRMTNHRSASVAHGGPPHWEGLLESGREVCILQVLHCWCTQYSTLAGTQTSDQTFHLTGAKQQDNAETCEDCLWCNWCRTS